jgi:hypothetical protein
VRRALVETALSAAGERPSAAPILVLGGSLPASAWGDPLPALHSLRYLASRPWVRPVDAHHLLAAAPAPGPAPPVGVDPSPESDADPLLDALREAPDNNLGRAAWEAYAALFAPVQPASPDLPGLRSNYVRDAWSLLEAAKWAQEPGRIATCVQDPDHDGQPECLLASGSLYTQFEIESGALTHAFAVLPCEAVDQLSIKDVRSAAMLEKPDQLCELCDKLQGGSIHQWIAPSSQFISGLSDPLFWDLQGGVAADPSVQPGAFAEPGQGYQANLEGESLVFTSADGGTRKRFRLTANGMQVAYRFTARPPFAAIQIPLALDPWRRFSPFWADAYRGERLADGWAWRIEPGPQVRALTSTPLSAHSFLASRPFFDRSEDPNKDYPLGHALPFPLAQLEIPLAGDLEIKIEVR